LKCSELDTSLFDTDSHWPDAAPSSYADECGALDYVNACCGEDERNAYECYCVLRYEREGNTSAAIDECADRTETAYLPPGFLTGTDETGHYGWRCDGSGCVFDDQSYTSSEETFIDQDWEAVGVCEQPYNFSGDFYRGPGTRFFDGVKAVETYSSGMGARVTSEGISPSSAGVVGVFPPEMSSTPIHVMYATGGRELCLQRAEPVQGAGQGAERFCRGFAVSLCGGER
jgi:hypothetical protein